MAPVTSWCPLDLRPADAGTGPSALFRPAANQADRGHELGFVSKLPFHGFSDHARIREITQRHGGQNNGSLVTEG